MTNQDRNSGLIGVVLLLVCSVLMLWDGYDAKAVASVSVPVVSLDIPAGAKAEVEVVVDAHELTPTESENMLPSVGGGQIDEIEDNIAVDMPYYRAITEETSVSVRKFNTMSLGGSVEEQRAESPSETKVAEPVSSSTVETDTPAESPVGTDLMSAVIGAEDYALVNILAGRYTETESGTIYDALTPEEITYLERMVETEVYTGPFMSKVYVAEVALARYRKDDGTTPMTIIITSPSQFSYHRTDISQDTVWAVEFAYKYATEAQNALYFKRGGGDTWYGYDYLFECAAGHNFYGMPCDGDLVSIE